MKKHTLRLIFAACLAFALCLSVSCTKQEDDFTDTLGGSVPEESTSTHGGSVPEESTGTHGGSAPEESTSTHGVVKAVEGDKLLVYFGRCYDVSQMADTACTYVPTEGATLRREFGFSDKEPLTLSDIQAGDYVKVYHNGMATDTSPMELDEVYVIEKCTNVVEQFTVVSASDSRLELSSEKNYMMLGTSLFDAGHVYENGKSVRFASIREGDVLEIEYNGMVLTTMPGQFGYIHAVRVAERTDTVRFSGVVKENLGTHLLVYYGDRDEVDDVNDIADIPAADCLGVPLDGVTIEAGADPNASDTPITADSIASGDRVTVSYKGEGFESAPSETCAVSHIEWYRKYTMSLTVSEVEESRIIMKDADGVTYSLSRSDGGKEYRLYEKNTVVSMLSLTVGDRVEVDYDGDLYHWSENSGFQNIFAMRVTARAGEGSN